jgi:hypothetical protein
MKITIVHTEIRTQITKIKKPYLCSSDTSLGTNGIILASLSNGIDLLGCCRYLSTGIHV